MACNFHAARMSLLPRPPRTPFKPPLIAAAIAVTLAAALAAISPAQAEKADRSKPMVIEADKPGSVDVQRQIIVFNGNVVISQGTMVIRADRVEVRETPDGYRTANAIGAAGRPASYRQKRDTGDESVEGFADRIEFDARADVLRFSGNASVRRLRGALAADEITGGAIVWDNNAEVFSVQGGAPSAANPAGRVRAVLSPRADAAPAPPTSLPAAAPLRPSKTLGDNK